MDTRVIHKSDNISKRSVEPVLSVEPVSQMNKPLELNHVDSYRWLHARDFERLTVCITTNHVCHIHAFIQEIFFPISKEFTDFSL